MKIGIANDSFPPSTYGGAATYSANIAVELASRGHDIWKISGPGTQDLVDDIPLVRLPTARIPVFSPENAAVLKRMSFDVVHVNNARRLTSSIFPVAQQISEGVIWTVHDYYPVCPRINMVRRNGKICRSPANEHCFSCKCGPSLRENLPFLGHLHQASVNRLIIPNVERIVAPSTAMARALERYGHDRSSIDILWNGVSDNGPTPLPWKGRALFVGRVTDSHKGLPYLLDALRNAKGVSILEIVGENDPNVIRRYLRTSRFRGRVEITISPPSMVDVYRRCDVAVLPSLWEENCSLVIQEAMMAGRPVIATDVGGNSELIQDGKSGLLVPAGNARAISHALTDYFSNRGLAEQMAISARRRAVQSFNIVQHVDQLEKFYQRILGPQ